MDLSGNQTNPLYAQLQPYVDNSTGAVSCTRPSQSSQMLQLGFVPCPTAPAAVMQRLQSLCSAPPGAPLLLDIVAAVILLLSML